jgi:hypothetical protein
MAAVFKDPFESAADSPVAPAESCFAIVPDDAAELPRATKALFIGSGGDLTVRAVRDGEPVTFRNLAPGSILDVRARAVLQTGTTAGDIVGLG